MDVEHVEFPGLEEPAETDDPAWIVRRSGIQAGHGPTALLFQGRYQRGFLGQQVRDTRIHEPRVAITGALDHETFGAPGP